MADALTRYADRLDDDARRLEMEILTTRLEIQDAKIERLEVQVEHLLKIQDAVTKAVVAHADSISALRVRDEHLARVVGRSFISVEREVAH